jgi:hypothetical protein
MPEVAGPIILRVNGLAPTDDLTVTTLPNVPVTDHFPTPYVLVEKNRIVCALVFVDDISAKVGIAAPPESEKLILLLVRVAVPPRINLLKL